MGNKKYTCPKCNKSFGSPQALGSHIGQWCGKEMSEETKQKRSEASKKNWENTEFKAKQKKARSTSKWKNSHRKAMMKNWQNPEFVASATSEERNRKVSEGLKGHIITDATKNKISKSNTGKTASEETKQLLSKIGKEKFESMSVEEREKFTKSSLGISKPESTRAKIGKAQQDNWKGNDKRKLKASVVAKAQRNDPEYVSKLMKSCQLKPNKPETLLYSIIQELTDDYALNVDGSVMILGGKIPDFVNINGQKKVVELFGDYWHGSQVTGRNRSQEEKLRKGLFKKFGYSTLIIWELELQSIETLKRKLITFMQR